MVRFANGPKTSGAEEPGESASPPAHRSCGQGQGSSGVPASPPGQGQTDSRGLDFQVACRSASLRRTFESFSKARRKISSPPMNQLILSDQKVCRIVRAVTIDANVWKTKIDETCLPEVEKAGAKMRIAGKLVVELTITYHNNVPHNNG